MAITIYISSTEEVSTDLIDQVKNLLTQIKGDLSYQVLPCMPDKQICEFITDFKNRASLTFDELFIICSLIRLTHELHGEDRCVLLTSKRNHLNWFSACSEKKNIFVDVNDWDKLVGRSPQFGIAYQVIENVFQSLIGTYYTNLEDNPTVHLTSIGCINDFCNNKSEVMLKLRTADICGVCIDQAMQRNVSPAILNQISDTINLIRNNVVSSFKKELMPPKLEVKEDGRIYIGNQLITLEPLPKTLFIFFLRQQNKLRLDDLIQYHHDIGNIYKTIRPGVADPQNTVRNMILPYHDPDTTFSRHKSVVNRELIKQLGDTLADFYTINRDQDGAFAIRLNFDSRSIDPRF